MQNSNPYAQKFTSTAADTAARAEARAARKQLMKEQLIPQLQANPQLMDMIHTVLQDPNDIADLVALLGEMNMGRGGKRRTKRRRTLKKKNFEKKTLLKN